MSNDFHNILANFRKASEEPAKLPVQDKKPKKSNKLTESVATLESQYKSFKDRVSEGCCDQDLEEEQLFPQDGNEFADEEEEVEEGMTGHPDTWSDPRDDEPEFNSSGYERNVWMGDVDETGIQLSPEIAQTIGLDPSFPMFGDITYEGTPDGGIQFNKVIAQTYDEETNEMSDEVDVTELANSHKALHDLLWKWITEFDLDNYEEDAFKNASTRELDESDFGTGMTKQEQHSKVKELLKSRHSGHSEVSESVSLTEKAKSKKQQQFFGMVDAAQKGKKPTSKKVGKAAKAMTTKAVKDFASTKHKGLPKHVTESILCEADNTFDHILQHFPAEVKKFKKGHELDDRLYDALYDYYSEDMPYGIKKARDGDPYNWVSDQFDKDLGLDDSYDMKDELAEIAQLAGVQQPAAPVPAAPAPVAATQPAQQPITEYGDDYDDDDGECGFCLGTGEGQADGTSCPICGGSGLSGEHEESDSEPDDYDHWDDTGYDGLYEEGADDDTCPSCNGYGYTDNAKDEVCTDCNGSGYAGGDGDDEFSDSGFGDEPEDCPMCHGTGEGRYDGSTCIGCGGSGIADSGSDDQEYDPDGYEDFDYDSLYETGLTDEGNEFSGALNSAKEKGENEFSVGGKNYTVKEGVTTEKAKVRTGERPKGKGWLLQRSGQQKNEPHDVYVRKVKPVGKQMDYNEDVTEDVNVNISATGEEDVLNVIRKLSGMQAIATVTHTDSLNHDVDFDDESDEFMSVDEERDIEYVNTPREKTAPTSAAYPSGTDMHRSKKSYSIKPYRGDNPMAESAENKLWQQYSSILKGLKK